MNDPLFERIYSFLDGPIPRRVVDGDDNVAIGTTVGLVRRQNEDSSLFARIRYASSPDRDFDIGIVCDGLGGMEEGKRASMLAASAFLSAILRAPRRYHTEHKLHQAANIANKVVCDALETSGGSTLSALLLDRSSRFHTTNVGDSRIYVASAIGELHQITQDDTLGQLLNRQNEHFSDSHKLVQFVGMGEGVEPHVHSYKIDPVVDWFLISSDGIHNSSSEVLNRATRNTKSMSEIVRRFIGLSENFGGLDNATAIAVRSIFIPGPKISGGINISLLRPGRQLEIWIPPAGELNPGLQDQNSLAEPAPRPAFEPEPDRVERGPREPRRAPRRKTKAKQKKQSEDVDTPLLLGPPSLSVEFPEGDDSN